MEKSDGIATLTLGRGKVNALIGEVLDEMRHALEELKADPEIGAVIVTGRGKFFSFGFDIPEFLSYSRDAFKDYLVNFVNFYTYLFLYPKPVVAALNGHAIAGGCMIAGACDKSVMASGKAKISLNEITFGASVFAGSTEMLRFRVGSANASKVLCSGAMYSAEEALGIGLVDEVAAGEDLMPRARECAADLAAKGGPAFASLKALLRKPIVDEVAHREEQSIRDFLDIWYSEETWAKLQKIKIY